VPIYALGEYELDFHETAFIHPDAVVIGRRLDR
jgi:carbonic anhydrase/acetyltransferase-like protein (isoleucine patch superfamily)